MSPDSALRGQAGAEELSALRRVIRRLRPRPSEQRRLMRMSIEDWSINLNGKALQSSTWMGVHASKNPLDAWIYQEILYETRPDTIVELGSADGGSALFLAQMLDLLGGEGTVVSVDASHETFAAAHDRIVTITGL